MKRMMVAYDDSLETSQYKWMGVLFAVCTNVSLAHHAGQNGQIQLAVHVADKEDLEIFTTIVRGNEASVMT